jgi:serine/threonine-protein phosphatase 6 regulatory ankyrin repeat subunit C
MEFTSEFPAHLLSVNQQSSVENVQLYKSCKAGSVHGVQEHLRKGGKPNYVHMQEHQRNCLHIAVENGHIDVVKILLDNGAVINSSVGTTHDTGLIIAAHTNNIEILELLLQHKADVNLANTYGNTALHEACTLGNDAMIELLIRAGASISTKNHKGSTPLHFYCFGADPSTHTVQGARRLLHAGADHSAVNNEGMTPLLVCCTSGRDDLITVLEEVFLFIFIFYCFL